MLGPTRQLSLARHLNKANTAFADGHMKLCKGHVYSPTPITTFLSGSRAKNKFMIFQSHLSCGFFIECIKNQGNS